MLDVRTVVERVGLGRSTFYRMMDSETFPKPAKLAGVKTVRWASADIEKWIKEAGKRE